MLSPLYLSYYLPFSFRVSDISNPSDSLIFKRVISKYSSEGYYKGDNPLLMSLAGKKIEIQAVLANVLANQLAIDAGDPRDTSSAEFIKAVNPLIYNQGINFNVLNRDLREDLKLVAKAEGLDVEISYKEYQVVPAIAIVLKQSYGTEEIANIAIHPKRAQSIIISVSNQFNVLAPLVNTKTGTISATNLMTKLENVAQKLKQFGYDVLI